MRKQVKKRFIDHSNARSRLFGVNVGSYPQHHFQLVAEPLEGHTAPLQVISCGFDIMCKGVFRQRENCDVCSFEMVTEGEIVYESNGVKYHCKPGDIFVLHLGSNNRMECVSPLSKSYCAVFKGRLLDEILAELHLEKVDYIRLKSPEIFEKKFVEIHKMAQQSTLNSAVEISAAGYGLLLQIAGEMNSDNDMPALLQKILTYFQDNIAQPLRIGNIAEHFNVSQGTIYGMFRRFMQTTPTEHITRMRMQYASRLLRESEFPIKEIASKCGFDNQMYFSLVFKQRFGVPPGKFRQG